MTPMTVPSTMVTRLRRRGRLSMKSWTTARPVSSAGMSSHPATYSRTPEPPSSGQHHEGDPDQDRVDVEVVGQPGGHTAEKPVRHVAPQHPGAVRRGTEAGEAAEAGEAPAIPPGAPAARGGRAAGARREDRR